MRNLRAQVLGEPPGARSGLRRVLARPVDELLAFFAHHCTRCAVLAPYLPSRMCRRLLLLLAAC